MKPIREKSHRLPDGAYHGRIFVSFTACERRRQPLLACNEVHTAVSESLTIAASQYGCVVPIYSLMPDHLHVLVFGTQNTSRPLLLMESFKQKSGNWFAAHRPEIEWQKDFHDRIVREAEGYESKARYIALNPVRAGLADDVYAYPFTGSIGFELCEIIEEAWWSK